MRLLEAIPFMEGSQHPNLDAPGYKTSLILPLLHAACPKFHRSFPIVFDALH